MTRSSLVSIVGLSALAAFVACGGNSSGDDDGNGSAGESGSSGSGGSSSSGRGGAASGAAGKGGTGGTGAGATGGSAGTAPNGGDAGTVPTGGTAGTDITGGTSGVGGSAGTGGGGSECETADDCVMFSDCCSCEAIPKGASHPSCDLVCITDHCTAQQIDRTAVTCSFGRCVIDLSCDHAKATCDSLPAPCPDDQVRALNEGGCWGPCLPPTECREVTDCSACGGNVCVIKEPQIRSFGCVNPGDDCAKGNYCECLGACPGGGFVCTEADDAVHCPCPVC